MIKIEDFEKVDMRVGTIISASVNKGARKPAYKLTIDFGDLIGVKTSSAQITGLYKPEDLIGKKIVAVIKISEVKSEVRLLGADTSGGVCLLTFDKEVQNGMRIY